MTSRRARTALLLALAGCGGATTGTTAGDGGRDGAPAVPVEGGGGDGAVVDSGEGLEAGLCEGTAHGAPPGVPTEHRATAASCPRTASGLADAAPMTCSTDAECGGNLCAEHVCGLDACLVDADCASGSICVCAADVGGGNRRDGNICVPARCVTDADCPGAGYCRPTRGYCNDVTGYSCTSGADTCVDPTTDCACNGGHGTCAYSPLVGHFVCATSSCGG